MGEHNYYLDGKTKGIKMIPSKTRDFDVEFVCQECLSKQMENVNETERLFSFECEKCSCVNKTAITRAGASLKVRYVGVEKVIID